MVSGRPSIAIRLSPADVDLTRRQEHFFATPYGRGRWASVWVDGAVDWKVIESLLERSYRLVASKRLVRVLDSSRGGLTSTS